MSNFITCIINNVTFDKEAKKLLLATVLDVHTAIGGFCYFDITETCDLWKTLKPHLITN